MPLSFFTIVFSRKKGGGFLRLPPRFHAIRIMSDATDEDDPTEAKKLLKETRKAVAITSDEINIASLSSFVADDAAGAVATFVGTTRDSFQGKRTLRLEYEAYEPMAVRAMEVRRSLVLFVLAFFWLDRGRVL